MNDVGDIIKVEFEIGGYSQGISSIELMRGEGPWRERHRNLPGALGEGREWSDLRELDEGESRALMEALSGSRALRWAENYPSPVLDGEQWALAITFADGGEHESSGSNRWPAGFDVLLGRLIALGLPEEYWSREDDPLNRALAEDGE